MRRAANRSIALLLSSVCLSLVCSAKEDPVQWSLGPMNGSASVAPGGTAYLALAATVQPGWHLYSPTTPVGGPIVTKISLLPSPGIKTYELYRPEPVTKLDPNFNLNTETYTGKAVFIIKAELASSASGDTSLTATVRYQACSDVKCLPPVKKTAAASLAVVAGASSAPFKLPAGYVSAPVTNANAPPTPIVASPAVPSKAALGPSSSQQALLPFLLTAFGFGLAALFTPCVFPMIPITVSFFLRDHEGSQSSRKQSGWIQALVFCTGIVVLFTGLGFLITAIAGPFGVVQLGSSPWVNSFIAFVFFVFGLSLLGAFELQLPSGLLTRLNSASQVSGYGGTLLMGLTFALTSFACIGPIVGPLLIASVQSKGAQPVLGMFAFATGLAAPFFLLALFPSYLQKLPRSGGWMVRVKIVLGFIVLAVMLKYLANVDQVLQTHWLTRERFLAAWIVLFAFPGLYLLGQLPMDGIKRDEHLSVTRALIAALFLIVSISFVPGLFGAPLGDLDAFVPEASASSFGRLGGSAQAASTAAFKNDLKGALAAAREQNKLVLVNFTGYACTNCHWMKANMFPRPEIQAALKDMVIVDLFTDGTDAESDKNQKFEDEMFKTASIPFYAVLDSGSNVIATFPQLTRDSHEFLTFLQTRPANKTQTTAAESQLQPAS